VIGALDPAHQVAPDLADDLDGCKRFLRSAPSCCCAPSTLATSFVDEAAAVPECRAGCRAYDPCVGRRSLAAPTDYPPKNGGVRTPSSHPRRCRTVTFRSDDQLELVTALEEENLRRVARLDHHVETSLHNSRCHAQLRPVADSQFRCL